MMSHAPFLCRISPDLMNNDQQKTSGHVWLKWGGIGSVLASFAHLSCIVWGGDGYRFFGAGEAMALAAERGDMQPAMVTTIIACMLMAWGMYAFSGAGMIRRLPFVRSILVLISAVYLFRGFGAVLIEPYFPGNSLTFWVVSSAICLLLGLCYAVGTVQAWRNLG